MPQALARLPQGFLSSVVFGQRLLVLSDAHVGATPPEVEESLLAFLERAPTLGDCLLLNGDIFDFWFAYSRLIPRRGVSCRRRDPAGPEADAGGPGGRQPRSVGGGFLGAGPRRALRAGADGVPGRRSSRPRHSRRRSHRVPLVRRAPAADHAESGVRHDVEARPDGVRLLGGGPDDPLARKHRAGGRDPAGGVRAAARLGRGPARGRIRAWGAS